MSNRIEPLIDVAKVYSLQQQLQSLVDEAAKDEQEVQDPEMKLALKTSRELIQTLVSNLATSIKQSNTEEVKRQ